MAVDCRSSQVTECKREPKRRFPAARRAVSLECEAAGVSSLVARHSECDRRDRSPDGNRRSGSTRGQMRVPESGTIWGDHTPSCGVLKALLLRIGHRLRWRANRAIEALLSSGRRNVRAERVCRKRWRTPSVDSGSSHWGMSLFFPLLFFGRKSDLQESQEVCSNRNRGRDGFHTYHSVQPRLE